MILCGSVASLLGLVPTNPAQAGSATWLAAPASGDWNTAANWTPATVPNAAVDVATFGLSSQTSVSLSSSISLDRIVFGAGGNAFTITVPGLIVMALEGVGLTNNSAANQQFVIQGNVTSAGSIVFRNIAAAAGNTTFNIAGTTVAGGFGGVVQFQDNASAAGATYLASASGIGGRSGGEVAFFDFATAGGAVITTAGAAVTAPGLAENGKASFNDNSTAGSATITNQAATISFGSSGLTRFSQAATAGSASILNKGATTADATGGRVFFENNSSALAATITSEGATTGGPVGNGLANFSDASSAGSATIINQGSSLATAPGGLASFVGNSTGGGAVIRNEGALNSVGLGGQTQFLAASTAGAAQITNQAAAAANAAGGVTIFGATSNGGTATMINEGALAAALGGAGVSEFRGTASGGNITITNAGGTASGAAGGRVNFTESANAGSANVTSQAGAASGALGGFTTFNGTATAGSATVTADGAAVSGALGGFITFDGISTAGSASLIANGSTVSTAGSGAEIQFFGNSTAANSLITTNGNPALVVIARARTSFFENSTAGDATLEINGGTVSSAAGGIVFFGDSTTGGNSIINVRAGTANGSQSAEVDFAGTSNAGNATISLEGAAFAAQSSAKAFFSSNASAGNATIINLGSTAAGGGATTTFRNSATAANTTIENRATTVAGGNGGFTNISDSATLDRATITNTGSAFGGTFAGGGMQFFGGTAGLATITSEGGTTAGGSGAFIQFSGGTAGNATITTGGGQVAGALGATTRFFSTSTAGAATLVAEGGIGGGLGGGIFFQNDSTGGTAQVTVNGNGFLDISPHNAPGVTIGTLAGSGNVFLGARNLTVGPPINVASFTFPTTFSGVIQDGGASGGVGGSLTVFRKTLTLTGANTYTGPTIVDSSGGQLVVNGSLSASSSVDVRFLAVFGGTGMAPGTVAVQEGGTLAPGDRVPGNSTNPLGGGSTPGTFTTGALTFAHTNSTMNYDLGFQGVVGGGVNDLTVVNGNLRLDGKIDIDNAGGLGAGTYRLFNYTGTLDNQTLEVRFVPTGFTAGDFVVDTSTPGQVNLIVQGGVGAAATQFWDGANTLSNNTVDGGTFTWTNATTNWTNQDGSANTTWQNGNAIFAGTAGTVTLAEALTIKGLSFQTTGYVLDRSGANTLELTGTVPIQTGAGVTTTIAAPITGGGILNKVSEGTLMLTAQNTYSGGTTIDRGTIVIDTGTSGNLGTGAVTLNGNRSELAFLNGSSAQGLTISTASTNADGSHVTFRQGSTAGNAIINNLASNFRAEVQNEVRFFDTATASTAQITNHIDSQTRFFNNSTAANAQLTNLGSLFNAAGGLTEFNDTTTAGSAQITNRRGQSLPGFDGIGGFTFFRGNSNAGNATILNEGNDVGGPFATLGGSTFFSDNASAANASIVTHGSSDAGAEAGRLVFSESSTAGAATLTTNGGTNGGLGGETFFLDTADGGTAQAITDAGGIFDISGLTDAGMAIGSIEGAGNYFLGSKNLETGGNDFSMEVAGMIQDGGANGGTGGSLTKTGIGTLTLSGANTYTGATSVNVGALLVNGSLAAASTVNVASGATLGGTGAANGAVAIAGSGILAPGVGPGTLTVGSLTLANTSLVNYELGAPGVVGGPLNDLTIVNGNLTLDGVLNITDSGGFGLGVYRLFNYAGTLTDNTLDIGTVPPAFIAEPFVVQSGAGQVNLIVGNNQPLPIAYWNGPQTTPNGRVNGGSANWDNVTANWTDATGTVSGTWGNGVAIFSGAPGVVTLLDNIAYTALQFASDGNVLAAANGFALTPTGIAPITTAAGITALISAPLTGPGGLAKDGPGTLNLTGASTYSGPTFINAGSLLVNGSLGSPQVVVNLGALLGGNGLLFGSVFNGGVVSPGNSPGTLRIAGNYTQSSAGTLRIEIAGRKKGQFDVLEVGGHASLDGTLELVRSNKFQLRRGDRLKFLTAEQGVSGEFSRVINPFTSRTILEPAIAYEDHAVLLTMVRGLFAKLDGLTPNQRAVAGALDSLSADSPDDQALIYLDERLLEKLPGDFDLIAPEELSSIFTISTSLANVQNSNLQRRTGDIRTGANGFSAAGLAINGQTPSYSGSIGFRTGAAGPTGGEIRDGKETREVFVPEEKMWGVFLSGTGECVDVDGDGNARGYDITTGGFTLGLDYKVSPNLAVGIAAGYAGTTADLTNDGRVWVNGGKLGLYATYFTGGFYFDAAVSGGYNSYDTKRRGLQGTARGSTEGGELNVLVGTGYDWQIGALTIGPTATFQYTLVGLDGFTEHGSLAPLDIESRNAESIRSALGFKASYDWRVGGVVIKPELRTAWQHEYGDRSYDLSASFAGGAGDRFLVNGSELGRDALLLGAGLAVQFSETVSAYAYYDAELFRENYQSHAVSGGVRIAF